MLQIDENLSHIIPCVNFDVNVENCGLLTGELSKVLLLFNIYQINKDKKIKKKAEALLYRHVELASEYPLNFKFAYGVIGLAWLIQFLKNNNLIGDDYDEFLDDIDFNLPKSLKWDLEDRIYDPFIGLIGKAHYLFERYDWSHTTEICQMLEGIVNGLDDMALRNDNCYAWLDFYTSLHNPDGDKKPYFNLGLAHGIPSIICFLSKCVKYNIKREKCLRMIRGGIDWLLMHDDGNYIFPSVVWPNGKKFIRQPYVLSWCYGILSVACAFLVASRALGDNELRVKAFDMVKIAVQQHNVGYRVANDENGVPNLFLCHGSYGVAYIFKKFYDVFQDNEIFEGYKYWLNFSKNVFEEKSFLVADNQGLLEGVTGVSLIDLSLKYPDFSLTNWDKIFFLDLL